MRLPVRAQFAIAQALVLVTAFALFTMMAAHEQRRWVVRRDVEMLERMARLAELEVAAEARRGPLDAPAAALAAGRAVRARVTLIDSAGWVVGDTDVPRPRLAAVENHRERPEVRAALAGRPQWAVRRSRTVGIDLLYVAVPARIPGVAVVRVAERLTAIARLDASLLALSLAAAAISLLVGFTLIYWVTGRQVARIRALGTVASRIGKGEAVRARELPADELGRLGRELNQMAAELRERLGAIERERDEREQILAHMRDGVALIDEAGRILRANRSLAEMFEVPLPPESGTPFQEFARAPELEELVHAARSRGRSVEADLRLWSPRPRPVRATATPLAAGEGAVLLVLHDLSEAEELIRMRQDFVANVSHELRTPLTSIRGYAETLLGGALDDTERRADFVRTIHQQADRLHALVEDLLSLAQLERPGARPRVESIDLRELVQRQAAAFRHRAERAGLVLEIAPGAPVTVEADRALLEQVVANLIDNAVKYTERGRVRVSLGSDEARVWCEVEDTGPGIPPEDLPRVFERFYRVDKARSREKGGTGLGLSIVKHAVALHGGQVLVRSRPGQGSTFRFEIPRG